MNHAYPFSAIVGQDEMKLAILIAAVEPSVGGVLVLGDRGTGKSTAVRALAALLPKMRAVEGCPYHCAPDAGGHCEHVPPAGSKQAKGAAQGLASHGHAQDPDTRGGPASKSRPRTLPVPVVDLPLGASEDRVVGALDIEKALTQGLKVFEPGLLARAHRGFLYIDEVNLLEDHLVDLLIDVAASGENVVEREGLSVRHPARFVLVGSGNPEEGELRPQLLDRFGLSVDVRTPTDIEQRVEVVRRREAFERDPERFIAVWAAADARVRRQIVRAQAKVKDLVVPDATLRRACELCLAVGSDGLRGELTLMRAARAAAALQGADEVGDAHVRSVAALALRHRLRRDPLDDSGSSERIERAVAELGMPRTAASVAGATPPQAPSAGVALRAVA
jgi:magnesium chelatase subunit I